MSRSIGVSSAAGSMLLDGSQGVRVKLQVRGSGMAPVQVQWFSGAGDGASFRGGRTLPRTFEMVVKAEADAADPYNTNVVRQRFAKLSQILALPNAPARLTIDLDSGSPTGDRWYADMVRVGGGDWDWSMDTDGRSFIKSVFTLQAGDPYWTSEDQESKVISPVGVGLGILGVGVSLAQLRLGSVDGFGATTIQNTGETLAYPTWVIEAPFSAFSLTSDTGEALTWVGTVPKTSGAITVNSRNGTVVDESGANRYAELDPQPQFWSVRPGATNASVVMSDAAAGTRATVVWNRRREIIF